MTYEIKYEPVVIEGKEYPKYNIYYSDGVKEFHSKDGIITGNERGVNVKAPNWNGLTQSLWGNLPLMGKTMQTASPNVYSTLLKVLTDGENNSASENAFLQMFSMLGTTWTKTEKETINSYLKDNNFTIQIA